MSWPRVGIVAFFLFALGIFLDDYFAYYLRCPSLERAKAKLRALVLLFYNWLEYTPSQLPPNFPFSSRRAQRIPTEIATTVPWWFYASVLTLLVAGLAWSISDRDLSFVIRCVLIIWGITGVALLGTLMFGLGMAILLPVIGFVLLHLLKLIRKVVSITIAPRSDPKKSPFAYFAALVDILLLAAKTVEILIH